MSPRIREVRCSDVRFPTSRDLAGSDARHPDPDYSMAYVELLTDDPGVRGFGFTFTIGRGTEVCVAAIHALAPTVLGLDTDDIDHDIGSIARALTDDSQLRWLGPEKGVVHLAAGALVNAMWDLRARGAGVPLWKLLADLPSADLVAAVDWTHLTDALTPEEATDLLDGRLAGVEDRERALLRDGIPAYTTSPGWLGYDDQRLVDGCADAVRRGYPLVKIKVGADLDRDLHRLRLARDALGPATGLAVDANQRWEVGEAIEAIGAMSAFDLTWVEEPCSPDDVLGHRAVADAVEVPIATGEHCANRVMFKQFLASGAMEVCQIDACRVAGVNDILAIVLLAAKYDVPVCPHAGGVGLCELVQHLSAFDHLRVSRTWERRVTEHTDHLHEHFRHPARVRDGRYLAPTDAGFSAELLPDALAAHRFPDGARWSAP